MVQVELEKNEIENEIKISASENLVKALDFHGSRLQCVVPNTMNFFNEDFLDQITFVLNHAKNIRNNGYFCVSASDNEKLLIAVEELRASVLACSNCIRPNFYESFDFIFNVLIRMINKRKFIMENFVTDDFHVLE